MFKVIEKLIVPITYKEKLQELEGRTGWSIGKPTKVAFMAVVISCSYERNFNDKEDYEKNFKEMNDQFVKALEAVGFTKEFIENKKKVIPQAEPLENDEAND